MLHSRYMATLGRKIAAARHEAGLTQAELAEAVGLTDAAVRHWESDRAKPPLERLTEIAQATGKPVGHFLDEGQGQSTAEIAGLTITGDPEFIRSLAELIAEHQRRKTTGEGTPERSPYPGIEELLADATLCERYNVTQDECGTLRRLLTDHGPQTGEEAVEWLLWLRTREDRD